MTSPGTRGVGGWLTAGLGVLLALIGATLLIGGVWLVVLGGSPYYLLAGAALIASGVLLVMLRPLGAWIYFGVWIATLVWAVWEVGLQGWPLVPRIVAPTILLALVIAALPVLLPGRGRRPALLGAGGLAAAALVGAVAIGLANRAPEAGPMPQPMPVSGGVPDAGADWVAYGGTYASRRYSPLTQITPDNVDSIERVWTYRTGDLPETKWGAETTPLKVGDRVYLCSARNELMAVDAGTGREIWRYDPEVDDAWIPYTAACRGVSYFEQPGAAPEQLCAARVIEGTLDGRLIAVDARTGRPCPGFGRNGQVDIKQGMGPVIPGMVAITSPPVIVRGVVVTGHQVTDGQWNEAPSGVVQGFDAITGELRWAWDLGRPGETDRPRGDETYTRGTPNMWTIASGDEALGHVYLPMGNSSSDYYSRDRSAEENAYATALVAIDVTSGQPAWSFQTVYVDVWDYDLGSQATLIDLPIDGGVVPALILPSKQGDLYVLDRRTGRPLNQVEQRPAPQGGVEPEMRAATQPHSGFHTLAKARLTERDMWGMSPIDQMICRIGFRQASYEGMYTPPTADRRFIQYPGYNGGSDWGGVAIDPVRGLIIANYNDMPNYNRLVPREEATERGWYPRGHPALEQGDPHPTSRGGVPEAAEGAGDPQWGVPYAIDVNAGWRMGFTGMLCKEPPYGGIRAVDIRTGRTVWDRVFGQARKNGPFGVPSMLPIDIGTPNNGGAVVTGSGLIFIAAATDDLIRAIDTRTGETLWTDALPAGGQATPITYFHEGRQYVVIMTGGHHFMETAPGDQVIAYALPPEEIGR